jgi:hypothetical protein
LETGQPAQTLDVRESVGYKGGATFGRAIADLGGARTILHVPLVQDRHSVGLFTFYRQEVRGFSDKEIALVENFAAQAVIAMDNARLITETREALEQQTATAEVLQVINASPGNLQPVFEIILDNAMRLCGAAFGGLSTWDSKRVHMVAMRGFPLALSNKFAARGPSSDVGPAIARLYKTMRPIQVPDLMAGEGYRNGHPDARALADLGVPAQFSPCHSAKTGSCWDISRSIARRYAPIPTKRSLCLRTLRPRRSSQWRMRAC